MLTYEEVNDIHKQGHLGCDDLSGGEIRTKRGSLVENLVKDIWESKGTGFEGRLQQKHRVEFDTGQKDFMDVGCDVDLIKDGELVGIVECKAYLDKCYLERAIFDFGYLKELRVPKIIVSLENAVNEKTERILKHEHSNHLNGIFYLCEGKRSSAKPLYKEEFFKPIYKQFYLTLQNFLEKL